MKPTGIQVTYKLDEESATILVRMLGKLVAVEESLMSINQKLTELSQKMAELGTTTEAAMALLAALKASQGDPTAVQSIIDQADALNTALAGSVAANTPPAS